MHEIIGRGPFRQYVDVYVMQHRYARAYEADWSYEKCHWTIRRKQDQCTLPHCPYKEFEAFDEIDFRPKL